MAKETIRRLADDVGRILVAGAHLASADPELRKDKEALDALAAQVGNRAPVIARLAEATAKALGASGKGAVAELIGLATTAAQVKAAQAAPAPVPGQATPLPAVPPVPTPCKGADLHDVYAALVARGQGRREIVERAIESGSIADLRLVDALTFALGDRSIGDLVSQKAMPQLGHAIVAPIRQRLRIRGGKVVDARCLHALLAVQKRDALDLVEQAVKEGSTEVCKAAMEAIADHLGAVPEFEQCALEVIRHGKSDEVRNAAVRALGGCSSEEALDALLGALQSEATYEAAVEVLANSQNPRIVEKMIACLEEAAVAAKAKIPRGEAAEDARAKKEHARQLVNELLGLLFGCQAPAAVRVAMDLLDDHGAVAATLVLRSGGSQAQLARIADYLSGTDPRMFAVAASAAAKLGGDDAFERLAAPFKAKDRESKTGVARVAAVATHLEGHRAEIGPRWGSFLLGFLPRAPSRLTEHVVILLGAAREKRALEPLLKLLAAQRQGELLLAVITALGHLGEPAAIAPLLRRARGSLSQAVSWAILEINDPSAVEQVRALCAGMKNPDDEENGELCSLLETLEGRFPGK